MLKKELKQSKKFVLSAFVCSSDFHKVRPQCLYTVQLLYKMQQTEYLTTLCLKANRIYAAEFILNEALVKNGGGEAK